MIVPSYGKESKILGTCSHKSGNILQDFDITSCEGRDRKSYFSLFSISVKIFSKIVKTFPNFHLNVENNFVRSH